MTEQDKRARVEAWLAEAQDEPTAFGKAVLEIARERGFPPELAEDADLLGLNEEHTIELVDHLDGVDPGNQYPVDFVQAVAEALGVDHWDPADYEESTKLAYTHLYQKPYLGRGHSEERAND